MPSRLLASSVVSSAAVEHMHQASCACAAIDGERFTQRVSFATPDVTGYSTRWLLCYVFEHQGQASVSQV